MTRVPFNEAYSRAIRLRCPRCGQGELFAGFFRMHERCSGCGMKYEREPGYFLGSIYFNYGWTAMSMSFLYIVLRYVFDLPNSYVVPPLLVYVVVVPTVLHRYSRAVWLAFDCHFDHTDLPDVANPAENQPEATKSDNAGV